MLNWEVEFKRWAPAFKLLTYYGSPKERAAKRAGWSRPNAFHVCITSYTLVLQDARPFRRKRWKYLVLDEAHMIKNWRSQRWQVRCWVAVVGRWSVVGGFDCWLRVLGF
jgi:SNF2 family DNA or RNA helicase